MAADACWANRTAAGTAPKNFRRFIAASKNFARALFPIYDLEDWVNASANVYSNVAAVSD
jgi:hypothetical protein